MPGEDIQVTAADGGTFTAYLSTPPSGHGPGLLVLPEIYNANDHIRSVVDGFADEGFVALAPDVFWRLKPDTYLPYTGSLFADRPAAIHGLAARGARPRVRP